MFSKADIYSGTEIDKLNADKHSILSAATGILVIDDDKDILHAARLLLKAHYPLVNASAYPEDIEALLEEGSYGLLLLDMNFARGNSSGQEGLHWLRQVKAKFPEVKVVMITAFGDVSLAIQAIKEGASDFVLKPWMNDKLLETVANALGAQTRKTGGAAKAESSKTANFFEGMIGKSPAMRDVFTLVEKVSHTPANILILGENGTGKEVLAQIIHAHSQRADEAFVAVDMGAISESLFESELFGHIKGSFTDARENRAGRFEAANGGTLFLDEIGNLSLPLQAKLLNALQTRKITRVGSNKEIPVDIRLISATNRPIQQMVEEQTFRQDLLFRINTIEIALPPLRERHGDIPLLAAHYIEQYGKKYNKWPLALSAAALRKLEEYNWPGNVRELQHAVERAVILCSGNTLQPEDFAFSAAARKQAGAMNLDSYNLEHAEKLLILKALEKSQGNISRAATQLGLSRAALYRRMEKYGL